MSLSWNKKFGLIVRSTRRSHRVTAEGLRSLTEGDTVRHIVTVWHRIPVTFTFLQRIKQLIVEKTAVYSYIGANAASALWSKPDCAPTQSYWTKSQFPNTFQKLISCICKPNHVLRNCTLKKNLPINWKRVLLSSNPILSATPPYTLINFLNNRWPPKWDPDMGENIFAFVFHPLEKKDLQIPIFAMVITTHFWHSVYITSKTHFCHP